MTNPYYVPKSGILGRPRRISFGAVMVRILGVGCCMASLVLAVALPVGAAPGAVQAPKIFDIRSFETDGLGRKAEGPEQLILAQHSHSPGGHSRPPPAHGKPPQARPPHERPTHMRPPPPRPPHIKPLPGGPGPGHPPPHGKPPHGKPPHGKPPHGKPPHGHPSHGKPPHLHGHLPPPLIPPLTSRPDSWLPGACAVRAAGTTYYTESCLRKMGVRGSLPQSCVRRLSVGGRADRGYEADCLRRAGYLR